jgi:hypothetical protein
MSEEGGTGCYREKLAVDHLDHGIREGLPVPQEPALLASAGMDAESAASIE